MGKKDTLVSNKKWSEEKLFEMRRDVLAMWPTGADIDLEEAAGKYSKGCPKCHKIPCVCNENRE